MDREQRERRWLEDEARVCERVDADGVRWRKVYVGGGDHLRGWLSQCRELAGEANVRVEPVDSDALACADPAGEGFFRIWVRQGPGG